MDAFHSDRWDYIYRIAPSGRVAEEKKLAVFFKDDRLSHIQGDFPLPPAFTEPAANTPPASIDTFQPFLGIDQDMSDESDKQGTIDFLKENQKNFYKDNQ